MELINNKYILLHKIGSGSFGDIYKGQNVRTKEYVAIKIESVINDLKLLKNEAKIYQYLSDCEGIPKIKWFGKYGSNYFMVIDLLGNSLQHHINEMRTFSILLILKLAIKLTLLIKTVHDKGFIHRDIKPHNFLFGLNKFNDLYVIDLGFCKSYLDTNNNHIKQKQTSNVIGSRNYASISAHRCYEVSRRDDLESLIYMLLYFYTGWLPWNNVFNDFDIIDLKIDVLHSERYPKILLNALHYVRSLDYDETPKYNFIIDNFQKEIDILSKIN